MGGTVLQIQKTENTSDIRWSWNNGVWSWCCDRCTDRMPGIGAKMGNKDKICVNIAGDGCFRMNMNEIATAVRQKLPLIEVIINNHVLGMVRQWQDLFYEKRYSATVLDDGVDYVKLAEAMGATGYRATNREEFNKALKKALASDTPVVIDCIINSDDKVWPMVAPGEAISSAFTGDDLKKKQEE